MGDDTDSNGKRKLIYDEKAKAQFNKFGKGAGDVVIKLLVSPHTTHILQAFL